MQAREINFGLFLKVKMAEKQKTGSDIGEAMGITASAMSAMMQKEWDQLQSRSITRVAKALGYKGEFAGIDILNDYKKWRETNGK